MRFSSQTGYCLLDIDKNSPYHPSRDPLAIPKLVNSLEPLSLAAYLACTSSYSGGLHLYFPLAKPQKSWELAAAVTALLNNAGFSTAAGQLEVFPNPRLYVTQGRPKLFNGHRLPLQEGSYLLNSNFEPIWTSRSAFVRQWHTCQQHNWISQQTVSAVLKQARRRRYQISGKADQFLNDLNAEIELGWTGPGQTNRLLGRITMRAYIFHHVLHGGLPLQGQALIKQIVAIATALPGYQQWCQHQSEIEKRAAEWASCIENSRYFHYGTQQGKYKAAVTTQSSDLPNLTWNQRQTQATRQKIQQAVSSLLDKSELPETVTARFHCLVRCGIGGSSLYRHKDLWHPSLWTSPPLIQTDKPFASAEGAANGSSPVSLLSPAGRNSLPDQPCSDRLPPFQAIPGRNLPELPPAQTASELKQLLETLRYQSQARRQQFQQLRQPHQAQKVSQQETQWAARMQDYLRSDDPILLTEALEWAIASSARLQQALEQLQSPATCQRDEQRQQLIAILRQLLQLNWTPAQIKAALSKQVGKSAIAHLNAAERQSWLGWLIQQTGLP